MNFHPNYYGLVFISSVEQFDDIKDLFVKTNSADKKLIDCLRADQNLGGLYCDNFIICSPDILDFFGDFGPFAKKIIQRFPLKTIFVTYYNSVTSGRGICQIVNSKVDKRIYVDEKGENNADNYEDEYMQKQFGLLLPALLGLDIKVATLN